MISEKVKVLADGVIFVFVEDIVSKTFENKTDWGFVVQDRNNDPKHPRWGKVLTVGPDVKYVSVGNYILIESLQWTSALHYEDQKFWKTNETRVMLVSEEAPKQIT